MYGIGAVALAVIGVLSLFVRSLVRRQDEILKTANQRQDQMFIWFTEKMNGSLDALKDSIEANKHATEHNTTNLKTLQELFRAVIDRVVNSLGEQQAADTATVVAKLDELLARDRSQVRLRDEIPRDSTSTG